jgi:hypothetical protein
VFGIQVVITRVITIRSERYTFDDLTELYEAAEQLPEVNRHDVYAHHTGTDEWEEVSYRDSLWTDYGRTTGVVSSNKDFYNVIQYGEILGTVGDAIDRHSDLDFRPHGSVSISPTAHRMSARVDLEGNTVYASEDDPIEVGLKIRSGHTGFHALKYDVGAERQVCSNGMMAFISDLSMEQPHSTPFQPGLAYNAVDAVVESPNVIEDRLQTAQQRTLMNRDEALLVLFDHGLDRFLENPLADLANALYDEVDDPEAPTLWETYNAATRALTHYNGDIPDYQLDQGFEQAARLLENGASQVPDPVEIGQSAVYNRSQALIEDGDEERWDGERETLRELMEAHELQA